MNAIAPLCLKLDPLIRRLASDRDGEVVATVRAIGRQLDRVGLDWNDLADRVSATLAPTLIEVEPIFHDYAEGAAWLLFQCRDDLADHELRFCADMVRKLRQWEATPKQAAWLCALVARFGGQIMEEEEG